MGQVGEGQGVRGIGQASRRMAGGFLGNSMAGAVSGPRMSMPLPWWQKAQNMGSVQTGRGSLQPYMDWLASKGVRAANQDQGTATHNWSIRWGVDLGTR